MKTQIPLLADVRVASPCHAAWDTMKGDERTRFCGLCRKNVYNLSEMTRQEAENLLREKEGRLCVRYYQRADGTVLTKNCPIGTAIMRRVLLTRAVSASALLVTVIALFGKNLSNSLSCSQRTMGDVVSAPVPIAGGIAIEVPKPEPMMGAVATPPPTMGEMAYVPEQHKRKPSPPKEPEAGTIPGFTGNKF